MWNDDDKKKKPIAEPLTLPEAALVAYGLNLLAATPGANPFDRAAAQLLGERFGAVVARELFPPPATTVAAPKAHRPRFGTADYVPTIPNLV